MKRHVFIFALLFAFNWSPNQSLADHKVIEGKVLGKVICIYDWAKDDKYDVGKAKCKSTEHDRAIVTREGDVYILEPDDDAASSVMELIRTGKFEKKTVTLEGEIIELDNIKIIRVKKYKVE